MKILSIEYTEMSTSGSKMNEREAAISSIDLNYGKAKTPNTALKLQLKNFISKIKTIFGIISQKFKYWGIDGYSLICPICRRDASSVTKNQQICTSDKGACGMVLSHFL